MIHGISKRSRLAVLNLGFLAAIAVTAGISSGHAQSTPLGNGPAIAVDTEKPPVLLRKDKQDVNADGVLDTIAYFDSDGDDIVDAEAIDLGSVGKVSVLAIRCDADADGRVDDWAVVDAESEQLRAALLDRDDNGEVDAVTYSNGETKPLPVVASGEFAPMFKY